MENHRIINMLVIAASVLALAAALLFAVFGQDENTAAPAADAAPVSETKAAAVGALIGGLEERLEASPDDARGWLLLARSYDHLGDSEQAWNAYSHARELGTTDAALELKLATHVVNSIER
ncbi:MAG: hypothetical protein OER91_04130 [Gammaproteobacteria bacterium]|nr:hypothetical protein [Gammaproteobacteria bacterium]